MQNAERKAHNANGEQSDADAMRMRAWRPNPNAHRVKHLHFSFCMLHYRVVAQ
jgi:hypothetical protein